LLADAAPEHRKDLMFVIHRDRVLSRDNVAALINALEHFTTVLRAIQDGREPTTQDLSEAPLLNNWAIEIKSAPSLNLIGDLTDDPLILKDDILREISDLWIFAEQQGWVRGLVRWYRLGRPLGPVSPS
jgi:hypothetical protein